MYYIILAAGRGSRLKSLTEERPKTMVELNHKGLIEYILASLTSIKNKESLKGMIVTGYKREKLNPFIDKFQLKEFINQEYATTNMVYSLALTLSELKDIYSKNPNEKVMISYSDTIFHPAIIFKLSMAKEDIAIAADKNWLDYWSQRFSDPLSDAETFKINSLGNLLEIGFKPKSLNDIEGQYTGLLLFQGQGLKTLIDYLDAYMNKQLHFEGKDYRNAYLTDLLQYFLNKNITIKPIFFEEPWIEVDSEIDLNHPITQKRIENIALSLNFN